MQRAGCRWSAERVQQPVDSCNLHPSRTKAPDLFPLLFPCEGAATVYRMCGAQTTVLQTEGCRARGRTNAVCVRTPQGWVLGAGRLRRRHDAKQSRGGGGKWCRQSRAGQKNNACRRAGRQRGGERTRGPTRGPAALLARSFDRQQLASVVHQGERTGQVGSTC